MSSHKYEIIKTVYTTHGSEGNDQARLAVIQNTLGSLPLTNIATLDAITTHFTRLIELTSADESFVSSLAFSLTNCILRPRVETSLTQQERHSYRIIRDLFAHKEQIFGELKRASTQSRARAVSTDESHRRAAVEARNRAVIGAAKSRSSSPAPPRHKANASTDITRFPIQTSPTSTGSPRSSGRFRQRDSLEVPSTSSSLDRESSRRDSDPIDSPKMEAELVAEPEAIMERIDSRNGSDSGRSSPITTGLTKRSSLEKEIDGLTKKNSLGRSSGPARFPRKNANLARTVAAGKRDSIVSNSSMDGGIVDADATMVNNRRSMAEEHGPVGVTLEDKPMDYD